MKIEIRSCEIPTKMNYLSQLFVHSGMEMASLLSFLGVTVCVGAIVTFFVK